MLVKVFRSNLTSLPRTQNESGIEMRAKKKDGPNHPFQPNLTYFYEKNLMCITYL